jgi:hypothetical protein
MWFVEKEKPGSLRGIATRDSIEIAERVNWEAKHDAPIAAYHSDQ